MSRFTHAAMDTPWLHWKNTSMIFSTLPIPDIARDYWRLKPTGTWQFGVGELAGKYGVTIHEVRRLVREKIAALFAVRCDVCGESDRGVAKTRGEYEKFAVGLSCGTCRYNREEASKKEKQRIFVDGAPQRAADSKAAWDTGVYQSLTPLQFRVLRDLVEHSDTEGLMSDTFTRVGISKERGEEIVLFLRDKKRLFYTGASGKLILPVAASVLDGYQRDLGFNAIMNPMEWKIFKALKRKHAFVFPNVLLRTFVPEDVGKEFAQRHNVNYFTSYLNYAVNFIVTDEDAKPLMAYAYNGGYHDDDPAQRAKDKFRAELFEEIGLPYKVFTRESLWKDDELKYEKQAA